MRKKELLYNVLTYVTSALAVILGLLFIALSIKIFYSPEKYTQQGAAQAVLMALPVIIVFVLDVVFVGVYSVVKGYAIKDNVLVSEKDKYHALLKLVGPQAELEGVLAKEKKIRTIILLIASVLAVLGCALPYVIYFINYAIHTLDGAKDPTAQVITLILHALPWLAVALVLGIVAIYLRASSYKRSAKEAAKLLKDGVKCPVDPKKENKVALNVTRGIIIAVAVSLIVVGAIRGEAGDVLKKAAAICTECIGLG